MQKREIVLKILSFFGFELGRFSDTHAGVGWAIFLHSSISSSLECQCPKTVVSMWVPEEGHLRDCIILVSSRGEDPAPWHCFLRWFSRIESFSVPASDRSRSKKSIDNPFHGLEGLEQLEIALDLRPRDSKR